MGFHFSLGDSALFTERLQLAESAASCTAQPNPPTLSLGLHSPGMAVNRNKRGGCEAWTPKVIVFP